jgi:hypothetical protein
MSPDDPTTAGIGLDKLDANPLYAALKLALGNLALHDHEEASRIGAMARQAVLRAPAPSREAAQQPDPDDPITLLKRMSEQASALLHWLEQITPGRRWVGTILQGHIDRTATALKETVDAAAQLRAAQQPDLTALRRIAAGEDDEFNAALNECIWGATDETIAGLFGVLERALNPEAK